jgi:hypothetical protein
MRAILTLKLIKACIFVDKVNLKFIGNKEFVFNPNLVSIFLKFFPIMIEFSMFRWKSIINKNIKKKMLLNAIFLKIEIISYIFFLFFNYIFRF